MALNAAAMTVGANAMRAALVGAQLHSAAAGAAGTNNVTTAARVAITWTTVAGTGDFGLASALAFTGGAHGGPVYSVTLWSTSSSGGTFYGEYPLTGDIAFDGSGAYSVTAIDITGTAT